MIGEIVVGSPCVKITYTIPREDDEKVYVLAYDSEESLYREWLMTDT